MAYAHAERNLAALRRLEADNQRLLARLEQPDAEQSAALPEVTSGEEVSLSGESDAC